MQFTYRPGYDDGSRQLQYGLIAEEVEPVDPNLVVTVDGELQTVRYHFLAPLLVAEVQRLESERSALEIRLNGAGGGDRPAVAAGRRAARHARDCRRRARR